MGAFMRNKLWVAVAALLFAGQAWAGINDVLIEKAWVHESVPGQKDIEVSLNLSVTKPARLISVSSPLAASGEIQRFMRHRGKMERHAVASLKIPPHSNVRFGARSVFLVLTGLKQVLNTGDHLPVVLVVDIAGERLTIDVQAEVKRSELSYQQAVDR